MQSPLSAYRSFAAQILQHHRDDSHLIDKFNFAMDHESGGQLVASRIELLELIQVYLQTPGPAYIIIDGVDECEDNRSLIQDMLAMVSMSESNILFFSRRNVANLLYTVSDGHRLYINKKTAGDIRLYLEG